ncbi:hypothetical protein DRQ07_02760 [candidate division KSB1 bacterium]|nr:MAG: hypothetical protein DRQ07_02760 [candidate division KSB1 bacterium]
MLKKSLIAVTVAGFLLVMLTACSEQKKTDTKLPLKVEQSVKQAFPEGKIIKVKIENEDGKEHFEVLVRTDDTLYELDLSSSGKILNKEITTLEQEKEESLKEKNEEKEELVFTFDGDETGELPDGWASFKTGKGNLGKWVILKDSTAPSKPNVLAQTSKENFGYHFNIAVAQNTDFENPEISLKFKAVDGQEDQGGGPVWRYQDADNYYICRANPLESNFRVYKVVNGNRRQLASARLDIPSKVWHTIKVKNIGNHIQCLLNGKLYLDVYDETFSSGKAGLWTKADAVTYFDDFEISQEESESGSEDD